MELHVGHAPLHVARGDHDISGLPGAPELADEVGVVGEVRVEGQHELAPGCREALTEGAAIAGRTLHEHARAEPAGEVGGPVARAAVDDQYLARAAEGGEDG